MTEHRISGIAVGQPEITSSGQLLVEIEYDPLDLPRPWAAFSDDELTALNRILWSARLGDAEFGNDEPMHPIERELRNEIEQRGIELA
jgi:hypothetical protein